MTIDETAKRIKNLEIQGATNIALTAINSIQIFAERYEGLDLKTTLQEKSKLLLDSRPTEPLMQNFIHKIISSIPEEGDVSFQKKAVTDSVTSLQTYLSDSVKQIAEIGSRRIPKKGIVLTHCHSSLVEEILKKAFDDGKKFEVISTETRPRFQGRITAKNLSEHGISVTTIVDSAIMTYMNMVNIVLIGSDAVLSDGSVVNKIGSYQVALSAKEADTPLYVCTETYKFDPKTLMGDYEPIEQRSPDEVWEEPPDGVQIKNPAFEIVPAEYIHGLITEDGIMSPHSVYEVTRRLFSEEKGLGGKSKGESKEEMVR